MRFVAIFIFIALSVYFDVFAQESNIPIGQWRVHLPYTRMKSLAVSDNLVYTANESSIFYYDKIEQTGAAVSKNTGLNDVMVSALSYNSNQKKFIIGYENGNMDIVQGNEIKFFNEISRSNIAGSKRINSILSASDYIYVSGDFGVILFDLMKSEVKESYLTLTSDFSGNIVYNSALSSDKDSIFLATQKGVMSGKISSAVNLMDYNSWYLYQEPDSIDNLNVVSVCAYNGVMYAAVNKKGIYFYNGSKWKKTTVPISGGGEIHSLTATSNGILACVDSAVFNIQSPSQWNSVFYENNITPISAYTDNENTLWIASLNGGLIKVVNGNISFNYPNGPYSSNVFRFGYYKNTMIALAGGYNFIAQKSYQVDKFSYFENNTSWKFAPFEYSTFPADVTDLISSTYNDFNSTLYVSSFGDGLIAINSDKSILKYDDTNSPLKKEEGTLPNRNIYIGETALDKEGKLWIPNRTVASGQSNLHSLSFDGTWKSYTISNSLSKQMIAITLDDLEQKWIKAFASSTNSGIIIFDDKKNSSRVLTSAVGNGNLPDSKVNCIKKDRKGNVIIGTDKGIAVCYNPADILNAGVDLETPIYEGFPLLFDKNVMAIEVDGGNRKWIGTNKGLWLFDEDFTKVIHYFDVDNSPLLSDNILDVKIHPTTGELFIATPMGIISYRGTSTEGDDNYNDVKVFPNPVKPGFNGLVGIAGLATDAIVKITDVSGNLVYETKAEGGTAVWNVKDYNGRRASSGVYLIYSSKEDGTTTFVSKIAVVE